MGGKTFGLGNDSEYPDWMKKQTSTAQQDCTLQAVSTPL